ncbi:MAG: PadR family transcriptional regulator [Actinomycetota bacterium]
MNVPYGLLGLLEDGPRHGYDLKRSYDRLFAHGKPLKFGQVYATLGRLERDGLVAGLTEEPGKGPDRKLYTITEEGVTDLDTWLRAPEPIEPYVRSVIFGKVLLALLSGRPAHHVLQEQRSTHQHRMRELTRLKSDNDVQTVVLADYALLHLEADLKWIDLTEARLAKLSKEIGR